MLGRDEARLYRLIWQRALASQMKEKELETTTAELVGRAYGLRASATKTVFDGFSRVYTEGQDDAADELERRCRRWPRATSRRSPKSRRRSTSPSRRRASPRRR